MVNHRESAGYWDYAHDQKIWGYLLTVPIQKVLDGRVPVKIWTEDVEESAQQQLLNVANLPFVCHHVAAMPDVHGGKGSTVGTVIATKEALLVAAIGSDIGCGVAMVELNYKIDQLEGKHLQLRHSIERSVPTGRDSHKKIVDIVLDWPRWADFEKLHSAIQGQKDRALKQMGTLGGGNHLYEVCYNTEGYICLLLHSGSRHIGKAIADAYIETSYQLMQDFFISLPEKELSFIPKSHPAFKAYWHDCQWAQDYARANRDLMIQLGMKDLSHILGLGGAPLDIRSQINCHHNYIEWDNFRGENIMITRKGAIRAKQDELGIVLGSMGAPSYVFKGKGNPEAFYSAPHGAGRRMSRTKARATFTVQDLIEQTKGIESRKDEAIVDEIPSAYKPIAEVMNNASDLCDVVTELRQVICIKGG